MKVVYAHEGSSWWIGYVHESSLWWLCSLRVVRDEKGMFMKVMCDGCVHGGSSWWMGYVDESSLWW